MSKTKRKQTFWIVSCVVFTLLFLCPNIVHGYDSQQQITIQGNVTDENGNTLPGVSVIVKGTTIGTLTDQDGKYSISLQPKSEILVFSFIGMQTQEVIIGTQTSINVTMNAAIIGLEEVVVVGYGTQKKVSVTSAVSIVEGDQLTRRSVSSLQQAIQGKLAGFTILDYGGRPGGANTVMRIRGVTTLSNNDPLVIVDGIEQQLDYLNPEDIESISILKDASSTSIYGSRAANGVLLITTKRAKSGKLSVSYDGYYALQKYNLLPEHMGLEDFMRNQNYAYTNLDLPPLYTEDEIQEYVNATDRLKYPLPNTWFDAVFSTAPQIKNSLTIEGGQEDFKVRMTYRNLYQDGVIPNSNSKLNEFRINTDSKLTSKINVMAGVNYRNMKNLSPLSEYDVLDYMVHNSQWTVPKYPDGTYGLSTQGMNPLLFAEKAGTDNEVNDYLVGDIKANWEILKGLIFTTQLGVRVSLNARKSFKNKYEVRDYYNPTLVLKNVALNSLTESRSDNREFTINNLLNYSLTVDDHALNILVGYSQIKNKNRTLSAYRQGFYNNAIQSIEQGTNDATKTNSGSEYEWALRSIFSRFNYSYKGKYLFEANGRYDGSSRFMGDNQYSFFPSFSLGWRISEEKFWDRLSIYMNELKLRGSWGKTGNQAVSLYTFYPSLVLTSYSLNNSTVQGYSQEKMINEDLTWETTTQYDVGMDVQFLKNRISLSVDYYYKITDGILLTLPVPQTLGLNPTAQNAGRMDNKGWEFLVASRNNFGPLGFNVNLNLSINNNKVVDLAGTGPYISGSMAGELMQIIGEGYSYNSLWGPMTDGLFQTVEEVQSYPNFRAGTRPGDVKFVDNNEDGQINEMDAVYLGTTFPKYTFGSIFDLTYKNFSLNLSFQGVAGVKTRIGGTITDGGIWEGFCHEIFTNNQWTPENPNARFPIPRKRDNRNTRMSDYWVLDASYLRLKSAQLLYQIPSSLTKRISIERMSVYVSGTNLLTFSALNEWNLDAESRAARPEDSYGAVSLYTFGVNIDF